MDPFGVTPGMTGGGFGGGFMPGDYPPGDITPTLDPGTGLPIYMGPIVPPWGGGGGGGFAPGPGLGQPQDPSKPKKPVLPIPIILPGGITIGGGGGGTPQKPGLSITPRSPSGTSGASGGGGGSALGTPGTRGALSGSNAPPQYGNPLAMPQTPMQFARPSSPTIIGSFDQGGIVPQTGLYQVQGGEQVIPKKAVAKLHQGELVLPRSLQQQAYLGSYQGGGIIGSSGGGPGIMVSSQPMGEAQVTPGMDPRLQAMLRAIKAGQLKQQAAAPQAAQQMKGIQGALPGSNAPPQVNTQVGGAGPATGMGGGAGAAGGGVDFGQLLRATGGGQVPQFGQIATGFPGWQGGGPAGGGGPMQYIQPGAPPPYQSQFTGRGEKQQYEAGQITSRLFGGLLAWKQYEHDKQMEKAAKYGMNQTLAQITGGADQAQAGAQAADQTGAAQAPSQMGAGSTMQRQAAALGAPGTPQGVNALQGASAQAQQAASQGRSQVAQMQAQQQQQRPPDMTQQQAQTYNMLLNDPNPKTQKLAAQYLKSVEAEKKEGARILAKAQINPFSAEARGLNLGVQRAVQQQMNQAALQAQQAKASAEMARAQQLSTMQATILARQQMQDQQRMDVARLQATTARDRTGAMERVATARTNVMAQNAEQKRLQGEYQTAARNLQTLSQEYGKVGADLNAAQANLQKINPVERWWGSKNYQQAQARVNELQTQMQSATMRLNQAYSQMQSLETQWNAAGGAVTPGSEFNVSMDDINQMGSQTNQSQGDPVLEEYMKNVMQEQ